MLHYVPYFDLKFKVKRTVLNQFFLLNTYHSTAKHINFTITNVMF